MLTSPQIGRVWNRKLEAEARSLYFAAIANRESLIKRWITGGTFVLSSAVLVTLMSHMRSEVSITVTFLITVANGYQIATNQESKIKTAGKLHLAWERLECEYDWLWSHTRDEGAEAKLQELQDKERDLSETAATEIGLNKSLWDYWWNWTCQKYDVAHGESDSAAPDPAQ